MPGPTTLEARRKATRRAFEQHAEPVLANPQDYSPLKVARTQKGVTQAELAAAACVHPATLGIIEREARPGSRDSRQRIAAVLGVPVEALFSPASDAL
jgi:DNA-binding XRE family transcriptional regulator